MKIAIVGAGFAGVATGRVLLRLKHEVTIFEAAPDVGGVWSKTRSYPGLSTQSPASTYHFSDMPWPKDTPFCPTGPQVQAYIEVYVRQFGLQERLHLRTEVVSAAQGPDQRWIVITRQTDESGQQLLSASLEQDTFDHIVICNGPYSRPHLPKYPGKETFDAGGGRFLHSSEFLDVETARGKNILVVGYGKSACDVAVSACSTASSVTVVARKLRWKFPHKILGIVPTHMVLMPRIGEALFLFKEPGFVSRLLNGPLSFIRRAAMSFLQWAIQLRTGVQALGLIPDSGIEHAADGTLSVVTDGFFEGVRDGKIAVLRETSIQSLGQNKHGRPMATLSNGTSVSADLVLAGTGWEQDIPFLAPETVAQIKNSRGDFVLYRWIQPPKVDGLWFNGYAGSLTNASSCGEH
ncbi:hypothetical protein BKA62DRAFT_391123 [Auriculariales sp. MPI-PUGE-AT-0066]|nr:hypothetical protein BKA62DRAFT_391123 [Auriculariales sp. MPI-PUGE-AT-0066]